MCVRVGDVLLVRTERGVRTEAPGLPPKGGRRRAGLEPSVAKWLRERGVAALRSG
jgi:hypothetical protein